MKKKFNNNVSKLTTSSSIWTFSYISISQIEQKVYSRIKQATVNQMERALQRHEMMLYGNYSFHEIFIAFLYFLTHNMSYKTIETETRLPHSNMKQWFGTIQRKLLPYAQRQIFVHQTPQQRIAIATAMNNTRSGAERTTGTANANGIEVGVDANGSGLGAVSIVGASRATGVSDEAESNDSAVASGNHGAGGTRINVGANGSELGAVK
mgnify:CR=1 FL=1